MKNIQTREKLSKHSKEMTNIQNENTESKHSKEIDTERGWFLLFLILTKGNHPENVKKKIQRGSALFWISNSIFYFQYQ